MKKLTFTLVLAAVTASAIFCFWLYRRSEAQSRNFAAIHAQQSEQLASLAADHQHLTDLAGRAQTASNNAAEISALRAEADALQKKTNALARQVAASLPKPKAKPVQHSQEYWDQVHQLAGSKSIEARDLAAEVQNYAEDHQNQAPTNIDELSPYLSQHHRSLSGSNQFEIIYHGSLDDMKGLPWGNIAVIREQQTWPGPDGETMRVYGMFGGIGQIVSSDDNFQSWEAKHVIPSNTGK